MELPTELKQYVDGDVTFKYIDSVLCDRFTYFIRDIEKNEEILALDGKKYNSQQVKKFNMYEIYNNSYCIGIFFVENNLDSVPSLQYTTHLAFRIDCKDESARRKELSLLIGCQQGIHKLNDSIYEKLNNSILSDKASSNTKCLLTDMYYLLPINCILADNMIEPVISVGQYLNTENNTISAIVCCLIDIDKKNGE